MTHDRRFFSGMAAAALVTVVAGFAPTYFLRSVFDGPPLSPTLELHGALFTAWMVLFLVQALLVAAKRTDVHRRLGVAGAVLAIAMLVVGPIVAISAARRGVSVPGGPPPLQFLAIPLGDLVLFASLVGVGISLRRRSQVHKRLMLMATIGLLPPAIARLPYVGAAGPLAFFGLTDLFVAACLVYDRVILGRVHPGFLWGAIAVVASQPLRLAVSATPYWLRFAEWLTRG